MSSIDERVVEMKFNNGQFQQGAQATLSTLDKLKEKLNFTGAAKGLDQVATAAAANQGALGKMAAGVEHISSKFSALSIVAITALTNIVNKAVNAGTQIMKSLTIDPIKAGLQEYETNLNSIQTILANTQASGATLEDVNGKLKELNQYSDQTIYNFSEMARNIGTFTAAGVDLDKSTSAIKGIANLAALSGSNSQQASTAMYQLSQALSAGRVSLQDWNSVVNAGMGGTVFQRALAQTAEKMGTLEKGAVKLTGKMKNATINGQSFRESITAKPGEESWLTSEVLTATLAQFTGDLSDAELAAQGFSAAQIKAIQDQAKTAKEAATVVKTGTQLIDTLREAAGSGWAQTWELIIGDFEQAKKLWTGVSNALGGIIGAASDARNKLVGDWVNMGGREAAIDAVKNAFEALMQVVRVVKNAFKIIFPPATGATLYKLTSAIRDFTANLKMSGPTAVAVSRIFRGVFAVLGIGWEIIKQVARVLRDLIGEMSGGASGALEFGASIGDWLVKLHEAVKSGSGLTKFFNGLRTVLSKVIGAITNVGKFLGDLFSSDSAPLEQAAGRVQKRLEPLGKIGEFLAKVWDKVKQVFSNLVTALAPLADKLAQKFSELWSSITDVTGKIDFSLVLDAVNTGLFGALVLAFRKWINGMGDEGEESEGIFAKIKGALDGVTDTLKTMQTTLKSGTLMMIAIALGVLTASIVALSMIDSAALTKALIAITVMFTQLIGAMAIMEKYVSSGGMVRATAAMVLLAIAIRILASAVKTMAGLDWQGIAKGLVGVGGLLVGLALFTKFAETNKGGIKTGAGLLLLAIGIKILASAVGDFAKMDWGSIGKGLAAISGILLAFAGFTRIVGDGKRIVSIGAALLIIGISMKVFASAVSDFAEMDWETLGRGLAGMAGALILVAGAMRLMPASTLLNAVALVVVAGALKVLSGVIQSFGGMSWEEIGKGIATLAGALLILAVALRVMNGAMLGAQTLIIAAVALKVLGDVLLAFSALSWEEILKGLGMLAGVFLVLGLAGVLLTPLIPTLLGLGIAIGLIGAGAMLAGLGILAFSAGLTALALAGAGATVAVVSMVTALIGLIPAVARQIGLAVIAFANTIAMAGPSIMKAMVAVLGAIIDAIRILTPKIIGTLGVMLSSFLSFLIAFIPALVRAGMQLILGILKGIGDNIGKVVKAAADIIVNFLNAIAKELPRIIQSGVNLIVSFVEGLAKAIRNNSNRMNTAGLDLAKAIVEGMVNGIGKGISAVKEAAMNLARNALNAAKSFLGINSPSKEFAELGRWSAIGYSNAIDKMGGHVGKSAEGMGHSAIESMRKSISGLSEIVSGDIDMQPVIRPVLDLTDVQKNASQIGSMVSANAINVGATYRGATAVAVSDQSRREVQNGSDAMVVESPIVFNQYNSSPKALSDAEIYRQTKNQLSVAKGALTK